MYDASRNSVADRLTILRAAAADGPQAWHLPDAGDFSPITHSDPLAGMALNAAASLIADIALESRHDVGLVIGTTLGCLETDRTFDRSRRDNARHASPAAFARTLPSTLSAEIALAFKLTGPSLTLSGGAHSTALALRRAAAWMKHFDLRHCIAGGMDYALANPATPETCRVALLLLAKASPGIGTIEAGAWTPADLHAFRDASLDELIQWIQSGEAAGPDVNLGAGIRLAASGPRRSINR